MLTKNATPGTLAALREEKGKTQQWVADQLALHLGEKSRTHASISKIESQGTNRFDVLDALGRIYQEELTVLLAANKKTREHCEK